MEKFERNGILFTTFESDGERYLCTGEPTGEFQFDYADEFFDYYKVVGATSVVSGRKTVDELYNDWLEETEFHREVLGIKF
jgi:hypothetical protein